MGEKLISTKFPGPALLYQVHQFSILLVSIFSFLSSNANVKPHWPLQCRHFLWCWVSFCVRRCWDPIVVLYPEKRKEQSSLKRERKPSGWRSRGLSCTPPCLLFLQNRFLFRTSPIHKDREWENIQKMESLVWSTQKDALLPVSRTGNSIWKLILSSLAANVGECCAGPKWTQLSVAQSLTMLKIRWSICWRQTLSCDPTM